MSVIITGMDMPDNCLECPCLHNGEYGSFEKSWCNLDSKLRISDRNCPNGCKMKSVDGMIEKIEKINPTDYGCISSYETHNAVRNVKRDIMDIIKEYCGMED